jgi:uncharacterized phage-associated protein
MPLAYQFNLDKAIQAAAHIVEQLGEVDKIKLIKLIYLADREHFIATGAPITGDRQVAMPWGPVPSNTLDAINGQVSDADESVFRFLSIKNNTIRLKKSPGKAALSVGEIESLNKVLKAHGGKAPWPLANETHRLPEYVACYVDGTSTTIPYESIARASGDKRRFRHERVVIPFEVLASMRRTMADGSTI